MALFCSHACLPLSLAGSPAMQTMLLSFLPRSATEIKLPTRYAASKALEQLVSEHAETIRSRVAALVMGRGSFPGQFAVTTDSWTSRGVRGYLGVTIAYIDDAWTLQSPVVACTPLPPPHTRRNSRRDDHAATSGAC